MDNRGAYYNTEEAVRLIGAILESSSFEHEPINGIDGR